MESIAERQTARAIARAGQEAPKASRHSPRNVAPIPLTAVYAARVLDTAPHLLYLLLWAALRRYTKDPSAMWFWCTDAQLTKDTGLSPATLLRARKAIRAADLAYITTNQGLHGPTWYGMRFPIEIPDDAPPWILNLFADEIEHNGFPPTPLRSLAELARRLSTTESPEGALITAALANTPPHKADLRRAYARQLRGEHPWLHRQLEWAAPDLYRRPSQPDSQETFDFCLRP